ncbi:hypothetical protein F9B74_07940 [Pelistega sp. NLN82]|uniref:Septicolysin n=1 Tax=Pelistega ratti TaxID=2652177 RepID=A0A6L9Y6Z0_9BURK|nr:DIP1984 family protein [Pelistega ratti]NEN76252.1 hypothetical protein [Pelistega ratti]
MKLAEALIERAELQRRLSQLNQRLVQNAKHQEGEEPAEHPNDLLAEYYSISAQLEDLIVSINKANYHIQLDNGLSMVKALAKRDHLKATHSMLINLASNATPDQSRYSRSEIKMVASVDIRQIHKKADDIARQHRELDTKIQQANWENDL